MQTEKKKALLIGLNYPLDVNSRLLGCCNDVRNVAKYLVSTCGFKAAQVDIVVDEDLRNGPRVSRDGIIDSIYNLCIASWKEDLEFVLFHFSGHGSQTRDLNGEEADGMDEGIVPTDYVVRGLILDDFIKNVFLKFNPKTTIVCFFDCCHSGTIMDLPYCYNINKPWSNGQRMAAKPITGAPKIYCISGCMDEQTSADATDDTNTPAGAMTASLLKLLNGKGKTRYGLLQLQEDLTKLLESRGFSQKPLLTSSVPIEPKDVIF